MGSVSHLQGIFLTQESKSGSSALQADSLPTELPGKPHANPYYSAYNDAFKHIFNVHLPSRTQAS